MPCAQEWVIQHDIFESVVQNIEHAAYGIKVFENLVHAGTNVIAPKTGFSDVSLYSTHYNFFAWLLLNFIHTRMVA